MSNRPNGKGAPPPRLGPPADQRQDQKTFDESGNVIEPKSNPRPDGGTAYPVIGAPGAPEDYPGMSLRDHFAGLAMEATLRSDYDGANQSIKSREQIATTSYKMADAMIAERDK